MIAKRYSTRLLLAIALLCFTACGGQNSETLSQIYEFVNFSGNYPLSECSDEDLLSVLSHVQCLAGKRKELCDSGDDCRESSLFELELGKDNCQSTLDSLSEACRKQYASAAKAAISTANLSCSTTAIAIKVAIAAYKKGQEADFLPVGFKQMKAYQGTAEGGYAILVTGGTPVVCYVAFKGTSPSDIKDLKADLTSISSTDCKTSSGKEIGRCGKGFYKQYQSILEKGLVQDIHQLVETGKCPGGLRIYGHSLGGALSSILAAELVTEKPNVYNKEMMQVETFGEPRSFRKKEANNLHRLIRKTRWMNWGDPIPSVPPSITDFHHFGTSRLINYSNAIWGTDTWSFQAKRTDYSPNVSKPSNHKSEKYQERLQHCKD